MGLVCVFFSMPGFRPGQSVKKSLSPVFEGNTQWSVRDLKSFHTAEGWFSARTDPERGNTLNPVTHLCICDPVEFTSVERGRCVFPGIGNAASECWLRYSY